MYVIEKYIGNKVVSLTRYKNSRWFVDDAEELRRDFMNDLCKYTKAIGYSRSNDGIIRVQFNLTNRRESKRK